VIFDDDRVAAHVGIVDRGISAGGEQIRVAGIQNVFVLKNYRGQQLCDKIMDAAMKEAARRDFDAGLLYCIPELEKVYARCGWKSLPKENVIRVDENGDELALPDKNIAMFYPLKVKEFPGGTVHLQGNDW
jgi:predicted acetyltransferase